MAVPFSRPCYSGTSSNCGSGSSNRRPHRRPQQQQQQQQQQPKQQQQSLQRNQDHPVTRFLYGDGQIQLDNLSLTSRIAFYALYEAWRLLQDLTAQSNNRSTNNNRRRRPASPPVHHQTTVPSSQSTNVRNITSTHRNVAPQPDIIPRGDEVSTQQSTYNVYSYYSSDVDSNCSSPYQSPIKSSSEQVKRQRLMSNSDIEDYDMTESFTSNFHQYHDSVSHRNYPDMIPNEYPNTCKPIINNNNNDNTFSSHYPDLIPSYNHHMVESDDDDVEGKVFDDIDGGDDVDGRLQLTNVGGVNWSKLGSQLCQIASTFESTFYEPATEDQKAIYAAFQRIKSSSHDEVDSGEENSLSGLAKTICRQVLLSSIWILLKKVL